MIAYRLVKRGNFYKAFSSLKALNRLPITTPLGRKAITAAKFAIAIILLTALLLFSTKITAQEYVEFNVNESINLSNAFVRVSSNGSHLDISATELLSNQTISVNLSAIDIPKIGVVYIDLISNGEIIDSRKVAINNDELSLMPANETTADNLKKAAAIDAATKNINAQKPKHNKTYNLNSNGKELSLEIDGIYGSPLVQTLEGQTATLNNESIALNTDIIAVNESEFDKAAIVLPKNGNVNKILKCQDWDFNAASCKGSWAVSDIPFEQNSTHIWFTVNSFSGYAGAEITIIDLYASPKEGDMWAVRLNTTGKANLTIIPINNTNWTEFLQDNKLTNNDEISFESLKCGNTALNNSILVDDGTSLRAFNSIGASESITVNRLIIPDYECNETSMIKNLVHIPGYASLMFQFGDDVGYAYDPSCTSCSTCSALASTNGNTVTLSNSITVTNTTPCIEVRANNTRIHCTGFSINGTSIANSIGIFINSQYNTTIIDCNISELHYGIYLQNYINDTTIFNNTLDNLTYGVYLSINDTAFTQYRTNIDFNKFYNTTTAVYSTTPAAIKYSNNITNNTILLAKFAFTGAYTQENIIRNNTINASSVNIGFESGYSGTWLRNNVTHNIFLNNGTFSIDAADLYCIDVGNYYQTVKAANGRPKEDCGPHPSLKLIRVNGTAANNATFSSTNSNVVVYNHPILALGNANWNGSSLVQFASGSSQFNISRDGDEIFYSRNVGNTTFDCNSAVIWANQTSLAIQDWTNDAIGNCTIINATRGLNIINTNSGPGADNITIKDNLIRNVSYGIYIDAGAGSLANNNHIENNIIRNVSTTGIYTTPSGGSTTSMNITNNTIEEAVDGIELVGSSNGLITNNSLFGSSNPLTLQVGSGASFNNITRNNFSGGPLTTDPGTNKFCLDVGNAYLDEAAAVAPAFDDCGPTPNVREIRVDTSNSINRFEFGINAAARVNYSSLAVAAANAGNDTVIIVVNSTSNPFNGSIFLRYKFNVTIDCNSTNIVRNATGQAVGIDMRNTARSTVRNCNISNFDQSTAAGIHMTANNQSAINNVTFYLPGLYGIDAASGTAQRINITGSKFVRFTGGLRASGNGNLYWRFERNTFNNNTDGIVLTSDGGLSYSTFLNNTFYGNVNSAIDMQATIANESTLEFNNFTLNGYGIRIGGGGGIIRNNITNNSFFIHTTRGISFDDTSSSGNNVVNNTFSSTNASSADTGNDNFFNNSRIGNHWLEYDQSAEGCSDAGGDGFCDTNYSISGSSAESDFLPFSINEVSNCNSCSACTSTSGTDGRIVNITGNLTLNGIGACINVGNNNTIIQCNGFVISGNNSIDSIGIRVNEQKNTTIRNCTISSFHYGIYLLNNVTDTSLLNDTFDNSTYGIFSDVNASATNQYRTVVYASTFNNASYSVYFDPPSSGSLYRQNNITNSTFLLPKEGLNGTSIRETIVKNNTINASFIGIGLDGSNSQRNNVTRNIFMNGTVSANPDNFFCLDVGNAYLSNKYNQMQPVIGDCGPTPFIGEIRVDSSKATNFSFGATDKNSVVYPGLRLAAANSNNHTNIIVVNQTSINFTGAIQLDFKFNVTINCNGTTISGNVESVTTGIDLSDTQGATIKYCNISGFNGGGNNDGIEIRRANQTVIDNVTFSTPGSTGIFVASGNVSRVNITNSTFKWFGTAGIIMNTSTNSTFSWRIERNYFTNITGQAISIGGGGYHTVRNNTFFGNGNAIEWGSGGIMSNESVYEFNNFTLNNNGILTSGEATRNNVTNNSFFRQYSFAVNITSNAPTGNVFSNNTFNGSNASSTDSGNDTYFNDSRQGNHWLEYDQLAEGCSDTNNNGVCDKPYNVTGSSGEADFLPFSINQFTAENCNSCGGCTNTTATANITINLTADLTFGGRTACINVQNNDTIIECNNFTIRGNGSIDSIGIRINEQNNVTIRNCNLTDLHYGIYRLNNVSRTTILNNDFDNSTFGIFLDVNASGQNQYLFVVDFNKFYNTTNAVFFDNTASGEYRLNNITNNTFLLAKNGIGDSDYVQTIVRNNTFNSSGETFQSGSSCCGISRTNFTHNYMLNNGTLEWDPTDFYCLDVGNYYQTVRAANARIKPDCGPHPAISLVRINETAANNANFSATNGSIVIYNHPVLALGNANWNGSALVQFVSNSRQFNISSNTTEPFYVRSVANTTFDCNGAIIFANRTTLGFNNIVDVEIGNCTIINASIGIHILSSTNPELQSVTAMGSDNNTIKDNLIRNVSFGIQFEITSGVQAQYNAIESNIIRNVSTTGIFTTPSGGSTTFLNITNNTIEEAVEGIELVGSTVGLILNNSIFGSTNSIILTNAGGANRNNVTKNNFSGGPTSTDGTNRYCLDVGNAYLDEAAARTPAFADCGPTPNIREIRVDSSNSIPARFEFGSTTVARVNYSSLAIAAANTGNDTLIIVVNQTSTNFNGSINLQNKNNITLNCNGTKISRNGASVTTGIDLSNSLRMNITNCNISGFDGGSPNAGIELDDTNQTVIVNVTFSTPGTAGLYANDGDARRINVTNSIFNSFTDGIDIDAANNFNWRIEMNTFNNNTNGITTGNHGGSYSSFINNTFFGNSDGIDFGTSSILTNESRFEFNNFTLNTNGINFNSGGPVRNNFTNNSFFRQYSFAVNIASNAPTGNVFSNNTFNGSNASSSDSGNDTYFNDSRQGNHWLEYDQSAEGCTDDDGNRFCDKPYNITGSSGEADFLPFALNTAPSTLLISPNGTFSNSSTVQFICNGTDSEALSNMTVYANFTGTFAANTTAALTGTNNQSRINISGISDGNYIWNCLVKDAVNLDAFNTTVNFTISVDTRVPSTVTLNAPANSLNTTLREIEFNFSAIDNQDTNLTCNLTLNGILNKTKTVLNGSSNSNIVNISGLADNTYLWNVTCFDNANNSNVSETRQFIVDNIRPALNLSINDSSLAFNIDSIFVAWNATDTNLNNNYANVTFPNGSLLNQFTNRNFSLGPNNLTLTGTYNVTVYATDGASNNNITSITFSVNDTANPIVILISPGNGITSPISTVSFVCNATNDALSNISLFTDVNGSWSSNATQARTGTANQSNFTVTGIANGTFIWNCMAKDASNNEAFNSTNYTIVVDTAAPYDITLNQPSQGLNISSSELTVSMTAKDNIDSNITCNITLDGTVNKTLGVPNSDQSAQPASTIAIINISEGNHLLNATCYDNGNLANTSATRRFTLDTTRPALNLSINDSSLAFNIDSIFVAWNATDTNLNNNYANVTYPNGSLLNQFTNRNFSLGPNNLTLTGTYNITVYATDGASNNNITSITFSVTDNANPAVLLISPANDTLSGSRNVSFVCNATNDALSNISLFTDLNGSWSSNATQARTGTANQSNFTVTGIPDGTFLWNCLVKDASNNQAFNTTNYTISIDTSPPTNFNLTAPDEGYSSTSTTVEFNFSATDNLDTNLTCNVTVDNEIAARINLSNGTFRTASITASIGSHVWNVTCYDNVPNRNTSISRNFTINAPASEPAPTGGGGDAGGGGGAAPPPAPEPPAPIIAPPPVVPPEPIVQPEPVLPPIEDVLPGIQAEPVISSGLSGILEGVEAVQVALSSSKTKEGIELKFGGKGKIKLSAIEKKPKIIIEFGDDDFELSIPQYTEPVAFTSMLLLMLLLLTILVHGSVHHAYEKYASRLTETKKSAIRHLKSLISEADKKPKPSTIDKCMSIFSIYLAKELSIDKATYKASLKAIKERNKDAAHEFTKVYKEFARKQGKEITKKELKQFAKNIIRLIKRL